MTNPGPSRTPAQTALLLVAFVAAIAVGVGLGILLLGRGDDTDADDQAGPAGVETFEIESRNHVEERVDYAQTPPVGGDHAPVWQDCGAYNEPIFSEVGVHSLEHGAVWITYRPDLPEQQRAAIDDLAGEEYVLASPWADDELPAPVVLSAWGAQLQVDDPADDAVAEFIETYAQSNDAPEPGAACTGGYAEPAG